MAYQGFRKANVDDLSWIAGLEGLPENQFVAGEPLEAHEAHFKDNAFEYLIAEDDKGERAGYAQMVDSPNDRIEWRRIIIDCKGKGIGKAFMRDVIRHYRDNTQRLSIWLDVYADNARARHLYITLGFQETGEKPSPLFPGKMLVDMELDLN